MFDFHCLRYKSSCSSWSGSFIVPINTDVSVVDEAAGYLPQHLPALRSFLPAAPSAAPNVSPRVFSGGFSGRAEKEEGSLPPAAVRGLTGLFIPPPPPPPPPPLQFINHLWLSQFVFTLSMLWMKAESSCNESSTQSASVALLTLPSPSGWLKGQHVGISNILLVVRHPHPHYNHHPPPPSLIPQWGP